MRSCREISELVSKSLDAKLSLRERVAVRFHLMLCDGCNNFRKQMLFLHKAGNRYLDYLANSSKKSDVGS